MASNVEVGGYAVFKTLTAMSSGALVGVYTGVIPPVSTSYERVFTSADDSASINREGATLDLMTQEEGVRGVVITAIDKWNLNMPIADITSESARKFLNLRPGASSGSGTRIDQSYIGKDLMDEGFGYLIIHKDYASSTSLDVPTLTDPSAWFFANGAPTNRSAEVTFDPAAQQMYNAEINFSSLTSSSGDVVFAYNGTLTTTS